MRSSVCKNVMRVAASLRAIDMSRDGRHRAWLLTKSGLPAELGSNTVIALAVATHLESAMRKRDA